MFDKVACRTPAAGREGVTRIPAWKYAAVRAAILQVLRDADAVRFSDLREAVRGQMEPGDLERLGSLGWHVTTVKLNMEVEGELHRLPWPGPQRIARGPF